MSQSVVSIRRTEPEDFRALQQVFAQPKVIRGTLQLPFPSADAWKKRLGAAPEGLYSLVACIEEEIVGSLGLFVGDKSPRRRHVGEIGMAVHDRWQGRGVGRALMSAAIDLADNWLNLARLELTVYADNSPAIRLYERCGFTREGTLQCFAFREGSFVDAHAMARLRRG